MKKIISKIIRQKLFFSFWKFIHRLSNYAMNYGVASGYADYSGELYIIKKLKKSVSSGVIFDVGANIGDWSKFLIEEYKNENYNLYLFEPSLHTFHKLQNDLESRPNHHFYPIGFSNKREKLTLKYDNDFQGSASILGEGKIEEKIQLETIDEFCINNKIKKINFLKMDVQGYEFQILKGAEKMIQKNNIEFIQFEIDEPCIYNRIYFKDFWELLNNNFKIYHSLYNGLIEIKNYTFELENYNCMNYLAVHKSIPFKN